VEKAMGLINRMGHLVKRIGAFAAAGTLVSLTSCSLAPPAATHRLITHRALIDFTGLKAVQQIESVKMTAAPPVGWDRLNTRKSILYTHEQWRSPSARTGVGAAYIHLPLPLSASSIAWFAKQEYGKKAGDGKIIAEWTDELGRCGFEAENDKYHVRGYVTTRGLEAWIVYCGYRLNAPPDTAEISLAMRSAETFVPSATSAPSATEAVATK
jgi:hypothetical protein